MKKSFLTFLVTIITSVGITQLLNNTNSNNTIDTKLEESFNSNNEEIIMQLNQEYSTRTETLNNEIKNNLINSITLNKNEIIINYQNLIHELYTEENYQLILTSQYLNNLKVQYELNLISFDANNHINFDNSKISNYNSDVWSEYWWYWFPYWRLHLSGNAVTKIIQFAEKLGGISTGTINAITDFIASLLASWIAVAIAVAVSVFLIYSYYIILNFQNNANGRWIGIIIVPGIDWGRH